MQMTLIFVAFALLGWLASQAAPRLAYGVGAGVGIDLMLAFLGLAVVSALVSLCSRLASPPGS